MYRREKVVKYQQSLAGPSFNPEAILGLLPVWKLAAEVFAEEYRCRLSCRERTGSVADG